MSDDQILRALSRAARRVRDPLDAAVPDEEGPLAACARVSDATLARINADAVARLRPRARRAPARPRGLRASALVGAAVLVAAAAMALLLLRPSPPRELPTYEVAILAGDQDRRGEAPRPAGGVLVLRPDSRFELVLRPDAKLDAPVGVRAFLLRGAEAHEWTPPLDVSPAGTVRIRGRAGALLGEQRGRLRILLAVGRRDALPPTVDRVLAAREHEHDRARGFQVVDLDVSLEEP
jgi:hypothetical protein